MLPRESPAELKWRDRVAAFAGDADRVMRGRQLAAEVVAARGENDIPRLRGRDADARREFLCQVARCAGLDLDLMHGEPVIALIREADRSLDVRRPGSWDGLGDYPRNVAHVIAQLIEHPQVARPDRVRLTMDGATWVSRIDGTPTWAATSSNHASPAMALLEVALRWHVKAAGDRLVAEGKPVPA